MSILLVLAFVFYIGSTLGWVLELFYRRFFSANNPERKWINPGFCVGPYVPLYGCGLCLMYGLSEFERTLAMGSPVLQKVVFFIAAGLAMTLIELLFGLLALNYAHVMLWDYSKLKFNYKGLICPQFTFAWTALCAFYYYVMHPYIRGAVAWLEANLGLSFFLGVFFGVFAVDLVYSAQLLAKIRKFAADNQIIVRFERLKSQVRSANERRREKINFLLSFRSDESITEHLAAYKDQLMAELSAQKEQLEERIKQQKEQLSDKISKYRKD